MEHFFIPLFKRKVLKEFQKGIGIKPYLPKLLLCIIRLGRLFSAIDKIIADNLNEEKLEFLKLAVCF